MAGLFLGVFLFFASVVLPLQAQAPDLRDLRVTDASGPVTLKTADHPKQAAIINEETPLAEEDLIETGPTSSAELTMDGESVFKLQPGSRLRIKNLSRQTTRFELILGAMLAKAKPATHLNEGVTIKMPTAVVVIRGTELSVETRAGISRVGVFEEGHVAVSGAWGHETVKLDPNQETKITRTNVPEPPRKLDHFMKLKNQMQHLRSRAAFWHNHWRPISDFKKQTIRLRLADPHRPKSQGFYRPQERRPVRRDL